MDGGAWWAAVHGVVKSRTRLSVFTFTFHFHALVKEMATHSSVLAWRIPGSGEPGGLPSVGSHSRTRLKRLSNSSSKILGNQEYWFSTLLKETLKILLTLVLNLLLLCYSDPSNLLTVAGNSISAESLQSCPTLCDPIDRSPPGSPVPGFSRQEHWSGLPFPSPMHESEKWKLSLSRVWPLATPWTAAYQAPPSMRFSRQEYWSGVPSP